MKRAFFAVLLAGTAVPAYAANIIVEPIEKIGQTVSINGQIGPDDFDTFKAKASPITGRALVFLNSEGGNLVAALQIGEFIRLRGWVTFAPDECYSSCALIWLAGVNRLMIATSKIGFHAASVNGQEKGTGNALVGAYLNRLGLGYEAVLFATAASPDDITYLTPSDAKRVGIDLHLIEPDSTQQANTQPTASPQRQLYGYKTPAPAAPLEITPRPPQYVIPRQKVTGRALDVPPLGNVNILTSHPHPSNANMRTIEDDVAFLVGWYHALWNNNDSLSSMYQDQVHYYGKMTSKADVMADKQKFNERWPDRDYKFRLNSVSVQCNDTATQLECTAWGVVEWTAYGPMSTAAATYGDARMSTGSANFQIGMAPYPKGVDWQRGRQKLDMRISSEAGTVIERKVGQYKCQRHCYEGWQSSADKAPQAARQ
jgi:hypothetical protein